MPHITAAEFYSLIDTALQQKHKANSIGWAVSTKSTEETTTRVKYNTSENSFSTWNNSFEDVEVVTEPVVVSVYKLNIKTLLEANGKPPHFYPIYHRESDVTFDTTECENIFLANSIDEFLYVQLKFCLENKHIREDDLKAILGRLNPAQRVNLYVTLKNYIRNDIYSLYPEVDPERKFKDEIKKGINSILPRETEEQFGYCFSQSFPQLMMQLHTNPTEFDGKTAYVLEQHDQAIKNAIALTQHTSTSIRDAYDIYTILIDNPYIEKNQKAFFYLQRAMKTYSLKETNKTQQDLNSYSEIINSVSSDINFFLYGGLIACQEKNYSEAVNKFTYFSQNNYPDRQRQSARTFLVSLLTPEQKLGLLEQFSAMTGNCSSSSNSHNIRREYIEFATCLAEKGDSMAQFYLYKILEAEKSPFAIKYLAQAAESKHPEALFEFALFNKEQKDCDLKEIKKLIDAAAVKEHPLSQAIMENYHNKQAEQYKTSPQILAVVGQKRKLFFAAIEEEQTKRSRKEKEETSMLNEDHPIPTMDMPTNRINMEVHLASKKAAKFARVPDTTQEMAAKVEAAYRADTSQQKRNYVAANISFIFSNGTDKPTRTQRLVRSIPITPHDRIKEITVDQIDTDHYLNGVTQHQKALNYAVNKYERRTQWTSCQSDRNHFGFVANLSLKGGTARTPTGKQEPHKHSEYALFRYLLNPENLNRLIQQFMTTHADVVKKGAKIYGIVLDIYSNLASCNHCKMVTLAYNNILSSHMQTALDNNGFTYRQSEGKTRTSTEYKGLHWLTRIRAGQRLKSKTKPDPNINIHPQTRDLKQMNNMLFFHEIDDRRPEATTVEIDNPHLLFVSGTGAPRP